jgi:hypothetical protein
MGGPHGRSETQVPRLRPDANGGKNARCGAVRRGHRVARRVLPRVRHDDGFFPGFAPAREARAGGSAGAGAEVAGVGGWAAGHTIGQG